LQNICDKYPTKFFQHVQGERYIFVEFRFEERVAYWHQLDILENGTLDGAELRSRGKIALIELRSVTNSL